jgi:hypothetical protein
LPLIRVDTVYEIDNGQGYWYISRSCDTLNIIHDCSVQWLYARPRSDKISWLVSFVNSLSVLNFLTASASRGNSFYTAVCLVHILNDLTSYIFWDAYFDGWPLLPHMLEILYWSRAYGDFSYCHLIIGSKVEISTSHCFHLKCGFLSSP